MFEVGFEQRQGLSEPAGVQIRHAEVAFRGQCVRVIGPRESAPQLEGAVELGDRQRGLVQVVIGFTQCVANRCLGTG